MILLKILGVYVAASITVGALWSAACYVVDQVTDWRTARDERRFQADLAELLGVTHDCYQHPLNRTRRARPLPDRG